jgi:hypothetical protein
MKTACHVAAAVCLFVLCQGCAHHEKKSSFRIIPEGDRNDRIIYSPERAGETLTHGSHY